jgi:endonuclease VIII-like 1
MPELAEVAIMADFINSTSKGVVFFDIHKSSVSKVKTDLSEMNLEEFTIVAKSRGKEMLLDFYSPESQECHKSLLVTMGMSGNWKAYTGEVIAGIDKHSHLILKGIHPRRGKFTLCLVDVRRFAKWSWKENFSANRGPCPVAEHEKFRSNFWENISKKKKDTVAMLDVIMDQSIFNGIGNYLRAEIFHRAGVNPFESFSQTEKEKVEKVLDYCKICPVEAYSLGGGQLRDWKNSFKVDAKSFLEWRKVYGVAEKLQDKGGRTFWFEEKWKESGQYKKYINAN